MRAQHVGIGLGRDLPQRTGRPNTRPRTSATSSPVARSAASTNPPATSRSIAARVAAVTSAVATHVIGASGAPGCSRRCCVSAGTTPRPHRTCRTGTGTFSTVPRAGRSSWRPETSPTTRSSSSSTRACRDRARVRKQRLPRVATGRARPPSARARREARHRTGAAVAALRRWPPDHLLDCAQNDHKLRSSDAGHRPTKKPRFLRGLHSSGSLGPHA